MRSALPLLVVPLLALGLSACGEDDGNGDAKAADSSSTPEPKAYADTPVEQIGKDVEAAMDALETVHLSGNIIDDSGDTLLMDLTVSRDGDCSGSITIKGTGSLDIIAVDGVSYFKADDAFWQSQAGDQASVITGVVGDRWATDSTDPEGFAELCDLDELLSELDSDDIAGDDSKVTGTQVVDGRETVTEAFTSDDGNPGVGYVAADDPHHFLRFDVKNEGAVLLSRFDEPLEVEKPADAEIFDVATLGS